MEHRGIGIPTKFAEWVCEHPLGTYLDFPAFLTPSPPLVRFSPNLSVNNVRIFSVFLDPPLPLGAYVLNGCPLMGSSNAGMV